MSENIEKKWQKKWADAKLFESNPDEREKLFLTVAFPYPSGAMHIGHGRTYTVPDVYARFKRMEGYNVLFPMAWHVTGAPVIGIADRPNKFLKPRFATVLFVIFYKRYSLKR